MTMRTAISRLPALAVFGIAVAIGAFDLGSFLYLRLASRDFIVERREQALALVKLGERVDWRNAAPGQIAGWSRPEAAGTWSVGERSVLAVRLAEPPAGDLVLTAWVWGVVHEQRLPVREVVVLAGGTPVATWRLERLAPEARTARIPLSAVGADGVLRVTFRFPEHRSPRDLRINSDTRRIGIMLTEWQLDAAR
jgi:hypothetical protein